MSEAAERLAILAAFRRRYPAIDRVYALLADANGVLRGKRLVMEELDGLFGVGRGVASSILWLDITGKDIDGYDRVWRDGDSDRHCLPLPETLSPAPWLGERYGQVLMAMSEADGSPVDADARAILASVLAHYSARGLIPVVAAELEFYLTALEPDARGFFHPASSPRTGRASPYKRGYETEDLEDFQAFLDEVQDGALAMAIPAETTIAEYGPAQFEMTLRHQADALKAMDQAILFKRLVKGVALKHGMQATFMAKPHTRESGSGLHIHLSLLDGRGDNVFSDPAPEGSPALGHFIAGLKQHMAESFLVFAPHGNSYRRLRAGFYAPVNTAWGINNRTVSLRIPSSPPAARRIEHRVAGADANPYLVTAVILAAGLDGLMQGRNPGPAAQGDAGLVEDAGGLPGHWLEAIARFQHSAFLREWLGADFVEFFAALKRAEAAEFLGEVTALDYDWYLRSV